VATRVSEDDPVGGVWSLPGFTAKLRVAKNYIMNNP
jgi:hypothetical protein